MRRQSSAPGTIGTSQRRSSYMSCAMGDEDDHSQSSFSTHHSSFSSITTTLGESTGVSTRRNSYNQQHVKTPRWVIGVLCISIAFSWIRAVQYRTTSFEVISSIDAEMEGFVMKKKKSTQLLQDAIDTKNEYAKKLWKLKRQQRLFQHETRMLEEMAELDSLGEEDNVGIPQEAFDKFKNRNSGNIAKKWIEHRQEALLHKIYGLQVYIQEESRKRVIKKYGYGPHHVVLDIKSREGRKPGKITVRMAPLSTVPHAIETFLDMVTNKLLDNTMFYSHQSTSHLVAAAPISYGTFQSKEDEMKSLGFTGVSFPEYSKDFPHKKNTVGFSGMSTNFYINAMDNEDHHGPGGQQHHELEGDADPCFGEIIEGFSNILDMQYNRHKGNTPRGWQDYDLTRIITAKLITWP